MTAAAVSAFQKKFGISQVGTVGPLTMAKINTISCGGVLPAAAVSAIPATVAPTAPKAPVKKTITTPKPKVTEQAQTPAPASSSTAPKKGGWFSNFFGGFR
jgi:peptidoglycan hydrolase-like protein with peptidoglycan-binding domain